MSEQLASDLPVNTANMLTMITDPYHDLNLRNRGFPDGTCNTSAIRRYASRMDIICPFTLAAGESWNFHVFTTPVHQRFSPDGNIIVPESNQLDPAVSSAMFAELGPVNVWYFKYNAAGARIDTFVQAMGPDSDDRPFRSQNRTLSLGFEIHNITAPIHREGAITVYRAPIMINCEAEFMVKKATYEYSYHTRLIASLPRDVVTAELIPNTRTWEAEAGVYATALPGVDNHFSAVIPQNFLIAVPTPPSATSSLTPPDLIYVGLQNGIKIYTQMPTWSPLSCVGAISSKYTDTNQKFSLDMRQVLEVSPDPYDTVSLSYATTAPEADRLFLALYREIFNTIPPAVPVGFNAAGTWFKRVAGIINAALPLVAHLLPAKYKPFAAIAAPAVTAIVNKIVDKKINKAVKATGAPLTVDPLAARAVTQRIAARRRGLTNHPNANKTQRMLPAKKQ